MRLLYGPSIPTARGDQATDGTRPQLDHGLFLTVERTGTKRLAPEAGPMTKQLRI